MFLFRGLELIILDRMFGLILILVFGLIGGSFLTAFVDRLHDGRDFIKGRSSCDSCHKTLGFWDLIPLFSWLLTKGRCRHCRAAVSVYYPVVELMTAVFFVLFYLLWPFSLVGWELVLFSGWLVVLICMLALSIYDLKWWLLPNKILYPLMGWALVLLGIRFVIDPQPGLLLEALWSVLIGGGIFYVIYQISDKHMGGGDVKLGFWLGLLLVDWRLSFLMLFLSGLIGTVIVLPFLIWQRKKDLSLRTKLPFGPLLILAALLVFWFGESLIDWYLTFI